MDDMLSDAIAQCVLVHERNHDASQACPSCGHELAFDDRSSRPFALWYAVTCAGCGLSEIVHLPMGGVSMVYA